MQSPSAEQTEHGGLKDRGLAGKRTGSPSCRQGGRTSLAGQHNWTDPSSALPSPMFINSCFPQGARAVLVNGLGTWPWGSQAFAGEQLPKTLADRHKLSAGHKRSVRERDRDLLHGTQGGFLEEVTFKL